MGKSSGSQKVTNNTIAEPPAFQKPFLEYGMNEAKNLYTGTSPIVGYTTNQVLNPAYQSPTAAAKGWGKFKAEGVPQAQPQYITQQTPIYGENQVGGKLEYYGGPLVAGFTPEQEQAWGLLKNYVNGDNSLQSQANNALSGMLNSGPSELVKQGQGYLGDVMGGKYLPADTFEKSAYAMSPFDYNPESNPFYGRIVDRAMGAANSNASQVGAYGSSDWLNLRGNTAKDLYANQYNTERNWYEQALAQNKGLYENRWNSERGNQQQAAGMVPAMDAAGWAQKNAGLSLMPSINNMNLQNYSAIENIGLQRQQNQQREIDAAKAKWDWEQMEPWKRLEMYQNAINGNMGQSTSSTSTQPVSSPNPITGGIGGALAGATLAGASKGAITGPWGAAIGGGLGLLGSFF